MHTNDPYELTLNRHPNSLTQLTTISSASRIKNRKQQHLQSTKMYHQMALDNFPFGKQCIQISDYVSSKVNNKEQEDNARILEEFRKKAIEDKFHNKYGKNSRIINRYITQNMMPGVTLNPSMVHTLEPQLNPHRSYELNSLNPYYSQVPSRQHHYHEQRSIDQFYSKRKVSLPSQTYKKPISRTLNPEKQTIECQTEESRIKSYNEIDKQRKYYKMRCKYAKKGLDKFDKIERMLHSLNKQIRANSKFLQNVITDNHDSIYHPSRKGKSFSLQESIYFEEKKMPKKLKTKHKTEAKSRNDDDDQETLTQSPDWKLNKSIIFNSTQESFLERTNPNERRAKPTVDYSRRRKENVGNNISSSFTPNIFKKDSGMNNNEEQKLRREQGDMNKIRQHLKLLKKHAQRLDTIDSHSLVY